MFQINRKTDYAVRVGVALARLPLGARMSTRQVQISMNIPRPFLQRIVAELSAAGLVHTQAGVNGGLCLARPAEAISLRDIVEVMEGPLCLSECLESAQACPLGPTCPVRPRWGRLQAMMLHELARTSLAELAAEAQPIPLDSAIFQVVTPALTG